jgi:alpha-glucosidase
VTDRVARNSAPRSREPALAAPLTTKSPLWWQSGVVYQIYPRSFQDSDGDGVGDLRGIVSRLDYLVWLGVDALWLSPIFRSPMADFGYDVADYRDVDPIFGTIADLDDLVTEAHGRGLRVLLDFVPNHTSDQHPWFLESRSSRNNPKRDWYMWADPAPGGGPPNNWLSMFGGPGWEFDAATGQYYYHAFLKEQPDLNWRNPAVREAMYDVLRFWLDRGIDGFRVDVMWHMIKDDQLRDNPPDPDWNPSERRNYDRLLPIHSSDRPEVLDVVAEMRAVVDEYDERVLIGEIYLPIERLVAYYGSSRARLGAHLPFNFQLLDLPWRADAIGPAIASYEGLLPAHAWPNWVVGNHDRPRIASRVGPEQARVAAMLLLTLRGTPTMYNGDELGMTDVDIPPELQQDPARYDGAERGRDPQRTPMPWTADAAGGFTTGTPWLPLGADVAERNVESQRRNPRSMLNLYRRLLALRRAEPALAVGAWAPLPSPPNVVAYERSVPGRRLVVALNLGGGDEIVDLDATPREVLISTHERAVLVGGRVALAPNEGVVLAADGDGVNRG